MASKRDYYEILGVSKSVSADEIKNRELNALFGMTAALSLINCMIHNAGQEFFFNTANVAINEKVQKMLDDHNLWLQTKKLNDRIEIRIADNANGIPQNIVNKIFQPFFTTKPTGQGTGLGLSLAYDIVKAHGGEIKVETAEGEGSEFIIKLPM